MVGCFTIVRFGCAIPFPIHLYNYAAMVSNTPLTWPVSLHCRPVQLLCIMTLSLQISPSTDTTEVAGHSLWDHSIIHQVCSPRQRTWCHNCILFLLAKSSCNMLSLVIPYYFSFVVCLRATRLAKSSFAFFCSTRILNFHFLGFYVIAIKNMDINFQFSSKLIVCDNYNITFSLIEYTWPQGLNLNCLHLAIPSWSSLLICAHHGSCPAMILKKMFPTSTSIFWKLVGIYVIYIYKLLRSLLLGKQTCWKPCSTLLLIPWYHDMLRLNGVVTCSPYQVFIFHNGMDCHQRPLTFVLVHLHPCLSRFL